MDSEFTSPAVLNVLQVPWWHTSWRTTINVCEVVQWGGLPAGYSPACGWRTWWWLPPGARHRWGAPGWLAASHAAGRRQTWWVSGSVVIASHLIMSQVFSSPLPGSLWLLLYRNTFWSPRWFPHRQRNCERKKGGILKRGSILDCFREGWES